MNQPELLFHERASVWLVAFFILVLNKGWGQLKKSPCRILDPIIEFLDNMRRKALTTSNAMRYEYNVFGSVMYN